MRGRVTSVLLLLLLSFSSFADCSWLPRHSMRFRTTALDVAVDGEYVWLASGYGVQLLRGSEIVDSVALPGLTRVVRPAANGLTYVGSGSHLVVMERNGASLEVIRTVGSFGVINDIAFSTDLFVATNNGLEHYSLAEAANPVRSSSFLPTSAQNVTSVAVGNGQLYAADGDGSVEVFSLSIPSLPQRTGEITALDRATAVHVTPQGTLLISDRFGQNTLLVAGQTVLGSVKFGAASFAAGTGSRHALAGPDRILRIVDFSLPGRFAEIFELQLAPTDGTDNVIHAMARAGDQLYVAAGDIGLVVVDVSSTADAAVISYLTGATTSVQMDGDRAWFSSADGTVTEQRRAGNTLSETRRWTAAEGTRLHDVSGDSLVTSAGAVLTIWSVGAATPSPAFTATLPAAIASAVIVGQRVVILLADGSLYTIENAQSAPQKVNLPALTLLARSGSAVAATEVREADGKTVLYYWADGRPESEPQRTTIDGGAIGSIAVDASRAAIFTFNGVNVVDLASGSLRIIPDSNRVIPRQLAFAGNDLLVLDGRRLSVYANAATLSAQQLLPSEAVAFAAAPAVAVLATNEGMAAASYLRAQPEVATPFVNSFYEALAVGGDWLYLFEDEGVDVFSTTSGKAPRYTTSIRSAGLVGIAATESTLFTLGANGTVTAWSPAGVRLREVSIDEGPDTEALNVRTAGGAVWVSFSVGCTSGNCQKKTLVLDPASLAITATINGGVEDVVVSGERAWALFDRPRELRAFSLADPLHPSQTAAIARPLFSTSIAHDSGRVHVLAEQVYLFDDSSLAPAGERLPVVIASDTHRMAIEGGCVVVTGRGERPSVYTTPGWSEAASFDVPSDVVALATRPGRLYLLTGHSLEIWSTTAPEAPGKRRATR